MSKIASAVGKIASVVAFVAGVALLFVPGGQVFGIGLLTISAVASATAAVAMAVAQATMKPPDLKGSVSQVVIGKNLPIPLLIGLTYAGGLQIYDKSAPPADNKNRTQIMVVSAAGPIEGFEDLLLDYDPVTLSLSTSTKIEGVASGFYGADGGYLWANSRLGAHPDTALTPFAGRPAFTEWDADYKLSGYAAYSVTMEFDEDGKRFASGVPQLGVIAKGVKTYDPRLDSSYPGGSGSHDWDDESTWTWSENPALHALAYARGRFANGVKVAGCGFAKDAIKLEDFVELANLCEANGWTVGGMVYDGPGLNRWDNLKRFLQAAAAEPVWTGGALSLKISAPKVSVFTIGPEHLADGEISVQAMKSWRDKCNTIVPRVRLESQKWEYSQLEAVSDAGYVTEDGEEKTREVQFDLVQDEDQGAQLAAYELVNGREFGPITLPLKPAFMMFRPGEAGTINLPDELGLSGQLAVITGRQVDPATGAVLLTLESETTAKHAFALGQVGVAPPSPTIVTAQEMDEAVAGGNPAISSMPDLVPVVIQADHLGAVLTGQLPRNVLAKRFHAGAEVTTSAAWTATTDSGTVTYSIGAATGVLEITALASDEAVIDVKSVYSGITVSRKLKVSKQKADPPTTGSGGGTSASDTSFASINSASMAAISDELTVTVGSAGEVALTAALSVTTDEVAPDGSFDVKGRWQWWDGAAWVDQGAGESSSSPDATVTEHGPPGEEYYTVDNGSLSVSATKTGLAAASSQKFRLRARNNSGTRTMYLTGTATATGS